MKIIEIIPNLKHIGGAEKLVMELSLELKKLGNEVYVISLYNDHGFFDEYVKEHNLNVIYLNKKKGPDLKNSLKLKKVIKKIKPDVVHFHLNVHSSFFLASILKIKGIKFVETIHSAYIKGSKNPVLGESTLLHKYIGSLYKKGKILPVAISDEIERNTITYFDLKFKVPTIYNGVSFANLKDKVDILNRERHFIIVASLIHRKNHLSIINASRELFDEGYSFDVTVVGTGPLYNDLTSLVKSKNLDNNIKFLGERKDVFELLSNHKVFLLPSFNEGNPLSVIEAMGCGLVVIATNVGGAVDVIEENTNGFIVDPNDLSAIKQAMKKTIGNDQLLSLISNNNYEKAKQYSIEKTADEYNKLFVKLITNE